MQTTRVRAKDRGRSASTRGARRAPRQARSEATVNAIVDAATRVLAKRGYLGTTTNHIAERAGVSIGSFYEYFRNKDAVVRAVLEKHMTAGEALFAERAQAALQGGAALSDDTLLKLLVGSFVDFHADNPRLHRVLSSEVPQTPYLQKRTGELERKIVDVVARMIAQSPSAKVNDARLAAQICVQTVDALAHRWVIDEKQGPVAAATLTAELSRMLSGYLRG
jgi:AcrR family transcriptional regulator